ncbi:MULTISPECIES: NAD-dependent epimerase/dehydratase family protein [Streptomyces]|uniref:NAD(P)-dependent oxidoreductase n=2 Tax=Streptomyces TaxID=1883 RepID=A0ABU4KH26_9ACTN|nr:NAD(P)-dependent oxidoreductase [Streptomyces roseolus]MDX2296824.1 NAD(P)-dependent oxidoreductase [Streptomyces roseolus]
MRILLAGATGAIGQPLVSALQQSGHQVVALTRRVGAVVPGAHVVQADVLHRDRLLRAVDGLSIDVVIHELTALGKLPVKHADLESTNRLRTTGTAHLLEAARTTGARRFITQSMVPGYGYTDHGPRPLTENDAFGRSRGDKTDPAVAALYDTEQRVFQATGIDGIALRYGAFYGLSASQGFVTALRAGKLPVPRGGGGTMAWIHLADAAAATVAAIANATAGQAYNIVDDCPATWGEMFRAHAQAAGTPPPRALPGWLIRLTAPYFASLMIDTSLRISNAKAKAELGWNPYHPGYHDGLAHDFAAVR